MKLLKTQQFTAGRYVITPISLKTESGRFTSSVSIRSGQGKSTLSRLYGFKTEFMTQEKALSYAIAQSRVWLSDPRAFT